MIAIGGDEDLRLVFQATEGSGVDDPVAVALEVGAGRAGTLCVKAAAGRPGIGRKDGALTETETESVRIETHCSRIPIDAVSEPSYL